MKLKSITAIVAFTLAFMFLYSGTDAPLSESSVLDHVDPGEMLTTTSETHIYEALGESAEGPINYIGRAAIRKSTGKIIEYQSGIAPLGTLTSTAINSGIPGDDVEERYVTSDDLAVLNAPIMAEAEARKQERFATKTAYRTLKNNQDKKTSLTLAELRERIEALENMLDLD